MLLPLVLVAAVACSPENDTAYQLNQLGNQLFHQAQYLEALDAFRRAQVQRPDLPELNFNAGDALYKAREYERALRETQRTFSEEETDLRAKAHFNMGNAYFQMERFQDAYEEYRRALREDPNDIDAKINLELALRKMRERNQTPGDRRAQQDADQAQREPASNQQQDGDRTNRDPGSQQNPQQRGQPRDPAEELRRATKDAGSELTIEEALRILDVLRERERQIQTQYNQRSDDRSRAQRPDRDW